MKIIKNTITIISEIIVLILSAFWYKSTLDYEPLIALIVSSVGLITSLISKFVFRPKIELHHKRTDYGRLSRGVAPNNPQIITLGVDEINIYWELFWNFSLEIRNNSSIDAYSIEMQYQNIPNKTIIQGEIGKIEPLLANSHREFKVKVIQNVSGNHTQADEYLKSNIKELMKDAKITIKYKDESGSNFYTEYDWSTNTNRLKI